MTPQEALAQALAKIDEDDQWGSASGAVTVKAGDLAAAILAALPEGWELVDLPNFGKFILSEREYGARRERERLRTLLKEKMPRKDTWPEFGPLSDGWTAARAAWEMATNMALDLLAEPKP